MSAWLRPGSWLENQILGKPRRFLGDWATPRCSGRSTLSSMWSGCEICSNETFVLETFILYRLIWVKILRILLNGKKKKTCGCGEGSVPRKDLDHSSLAYGRPKHPPMCRLKTHHELATRAKWSVNRERLAWQERPHEHSRELRAGARKGISVVNLKPCCFCLFLH